MANPGLTPEQMQQAVDAVAGHGSIGAAARALGLPERTFTSRYKRAQQKGFVARVQHLLVGENAAPPEGYKLKGTSTLYGEDGRAKLQWVKTDAKLEELRALQKAAFDAMCKELPPLAPIKGPKTPDADLCNLFTVTDYHTGMLSWDRETGTDWDLKIAESVLVKTFTEMIDRAPKAEVGIINQLGDYLHADGLVPETPMHKHVLDVDSRFQKVVETAVRMLRRIISHALSKHPKVRVYLSEGNHDMASSVWLRVMFAQLYANNPRVIVEQSPNPYVIYLHGKTLLGFHHGHLARSNSLPQLFAAKFREEWGQSTHTYIHTGHRHHVEEKETPGVNWVQHATLAAPDAYAARGGWLSKRQATSMTYHKTKGEVARGIFVPEG